MKWQYKWPYDRETRREWLINSGALHYEPVYIVSRLIVSGGNVDECHLPERLLARNLARLIRLERLAALSRARWDAAITQAQVLQPVAEFS